jgi:hypothetical protein
MSQSSQAKVSAPSVKKNTDTKRAPQAAKQSSEAAGPRSIQSALPSPLSASPLQISQLQRTYGNRAVQRLIQRAQAEKIQREAPVGLEGGAVDGDLQNQINSARGGGQPVDPQAADQINRSLSADVSHARVHTDAKADKINQSLGAEAATVGNDIFFSAGAYNPGSARGQKLLAHELTHVVQQGAAGGGPNKVQTRLTVGRAGDAYEQEAERVAREIGRRDPLAAQAAASSVQRAPAGRLQRKMAFSAESLTGKSSRSARLAEALGKETTFAKIKEALRDYGATRSPQTEFRLLGILGGLVTLWLTVGLSKKGDSRSKNDLAKVDDMARLQSAIDAEWPKVRQQVKYLLKPQPSVPSKSPKPLPSVPPKTAQPAKPSSAAPNKPLPDVPTKPSSAAPNKPLPDVPTSPGSTPAIDEALYLEKLKKGGFKWLSEPGKYAAYDVHEGLLATPGRGYNKLSAAEIAAIRVYTGADYKYINPALAGSAGYLKSSLDESDAEVQTGWTEAIKQKMQKHLQTDPKRLLDKMGKEGLQHSAMAIQGLQKLPKFVGHLKRGEQREEEDYKNLYQKGKKVVRNTITSLSTKPDKAEEFALKAQHPKRPVMLDWEVKDARVINELSIYYNPETGGEGEVLLLPGAELEVVEDPDDPTVNTHGVLNVKMKQIN